MAEEGNNSLEYTPTWIVAAVCSIIVAISFCVERALHRLGKYLEKKKQDALLAALQKLKEELMLLGFISLLLTISQNVIGHICIPPHLLLNMLPCKRPTGSSEGKGHDQIYYNTIINRRRLLSEAADSNYCIKKGKGPLLSLESLHHLHIFIFVLAIVHVTFCVTTMLLGSARIRQWKTWEDDIKKKKSGSKDDYFKDFLDKHTRGYWRRAAVVDWLRAFFEQFYDPVNKSEYIVLRQGYIKAHHKDKADYDFHQYIMWTLELDFKKVVGISWYLWLFVVLFLLLNLQGWHTYFWLAFLPLILLLLVGTKLECIITRMAQDLAEKLQEGGKNEQDKTLVKPSDELFWLRRPALVHDLIQFILFQNSFEIAFFFWIWTTYGFDSCIMEKMSYIIPRLIMGAIVQVLCSYSTLPLYAIVTQMGSHPKTDDNGSSTSTSQTQSHKMVNESIQNTQIKEQAIILMEETTSSSIELPSIVQSPSVETNVAHSCSLSNTHEHSSL